MCLLCELSVIGRGVLNSLTTIALTTFLLSFLSVFALNVDASLLDACMFRIVMSYWRIDSFIIR